MDIVQNIKEFAERFNAGLSVYFPKPETMDRRVIEAMEYSVANGGKRLRPFLVCEVAKMFGVDEKISMPVGYSLEMLHSYSLIHDDLPSMDNDDLRRGKPTCHKAFDEATAILAGDGLLTYAFGIISSDSLSVDAHTRCRLVNMLSSAAGSFGGMVAGQMIDLAVEKIGADKIEDKEKVIKHIEEMKTGRLLRYACESGAVLGGATAEQKAAIVEYSRKIGMAFQIADDILDAVGDEKLVGKTLQKDKEQNKLTFVNLYGIEEARRIEEKLVDEAKQALSSFGEKAQTLCALADYMIKRDY